MPIMACASASRAAERARPWGLHTSKPSVQVWAKFSPASPHFPNQSAPGEQQLSLPLFGFGLHLAHGGTTGAPVVDVKALATESSETKNISKHSACLHAPQMYLNLPLNSPLNVPLQASIPWVHVYLDFLSLGSPHFMNQAPPRTQQLRLPFLLLMPHLAHSGMIELPVTYALVTVHRGEYISVLCAVCESTHHL